MTRFKLFYIQWNESDFRNTHGPYPEGCSDVFVRTKIEALSDLFSFWNHKSLSCLGWHHFGGNAPHDDWDVCHLENPAPRNLLFGKTQQNLAETIYASLR